MSTTSTTREPLRPAAEAALARRRDRREPSSSCRSPPWYSSGGAAGGSSDSRSSACSTVTATSSVEAIAVGFQPPRGSIGCRHGGGELDVLERLPSGSSTVVS